MHKFAKDFNTLHYIIRRSHRILLFAHSRPDADTTGSCLALKHHIEEKGKSVDIACFDPFPEFLSPVSSDSFRFPDHLDLATYEVIIACDSVERGFEKIKNKLDEKQVIVLLDHHPDITIKGDVEIIDSSYSSVCELVYDYLVFSQEKISREIATYLLLGIIADTGNFKHANTTPQVLEISSDLMKKGANLTKIVEAVFANKKISTLKLWGKAFDRARINPRSGMIATVLTKTDMEKLGSNSEDVGQVASILNTVPGTKFALILTEREDGIIKGSLRSEEYKGVDVSKIAARFGGGGHKLASGFEIRGRMVEKENRWEII